MTLTAALILITLTIAFAALTYYTAKVIQGDGYGSRRQPPQSHHSDGFEPHSGAWAT